jgi:hypothetical protein
VYKLLVQALFPELAPTAYALLVSLTVSVGSVSVLCSGDGCDVVAAAIPALGGVFRPEAAVLRRVRSLNFSLSVSVF